MLIYLDNCCFNRPFDDQSSMRIRLETEAKLFIQEQITAGKLKLIWSYILEYENIQNPFIERKNAILDWRQMASTRIVGNKNIVARALKFMQFGVKSKDALHLACAIEGKAVYFLTTDDKLLKNCSNIKELTVVNPVNFISILENTK